MVCDLPVNTKLSSFKGKAKRLVIKNNKLKLIIISCAVAFQAAVRVGRIYPKGHKGEA
jgi:hypothetical protein